MPTKERASACSYSLYSLCGAESGETASSQHREEHLERGLIHPAQELRGGKTAEEDGDYVGLLTFQPRDDLHREGIKE